MSLLSFRLGAHYYSAASVVGTEQYFDVVQIVEHENYNSPKQWSNDIALIKLSRPALLQNGVGLVCLSDDKSRLPFTETSKKCWTTGWGSLSYGGFKPIVLMQVELPLVSPQRCSRLYLTRYDANTMICAGRVWGGVGACHGDSGGPLVCEFNGKWYLEGVTSWVGLPCGAVNKPAIFAYVRKFKSWIIRKMNNALVPNMATSTCAYFNIFHFPIYLSIHPSIHPSIYFVCLFCFVLFFFGQIAVTPLTAPLKVPDILATIRKTHSASMKFLYLAMRNWLFTSFIFNWSTHGFARKKCIDFVKPKSRAPYIES